MENVEKERAGVSHGVQQDKAVVTGYPVPFYQPYYAQEDEISLIDIWDVLVKRRVLILGMTFLTTVGAIAYALMAPPVYRAETRVLAPLPRDVQGLSIQGVQEVGEKDVFEAFKRNLGSRALALRFVDEQGLIDELAPRQKTQEQQAQKQETQAGHSQVEKYKFAKGFLTLVSAQADKSDAGLLSVGIEWKDGARSAELTNKYVEMVDRETVAQLAENAKALIDKRVRDIERSVSSRRLSAKQRREDLIVNLTEAYEIASNMGLKEPVFGALRVAPNPYPASSSGSSGTQGPQDQSLAIPSFHHGTKALSAQIDALKKRASDDAFTPGLSDLMEEMTYLKSVSIDVEGLHAVSIDQPAYAPESRVKPNRRLIASVGFTLGLMLGVFGALFLNFVGNARKAGRETENPKTT